MPASTKPTHLPPFSPQERALRESMRDPVSGQSKSKLWYGGPRYTMRKKYGRGQHHKGRDINGNMIPDSGAR